MVSNRSFRSAVGVESDQQNSWNQVAASLDKAREFATVYVAAQAGRLRVVIRDALLFGMLAIIFAVVLTTFAVVSVVMFLHGAAGGIGALLGGRTWCGELIIGGVVLGGSAVFAWYMVSKIRKISRRKTVSSYLKSKVAEL